MAGTPTAQQQLVIDAILDFKKQFPGRAIGQLTDGDIFELSDKVCQALSIAHTSGPILEEPGPEV